MSWREQLQDASFRGVPFQIDNAPNEFARRVAVHEYPLQERAETEDLGGRAVRILLDGYVIGSEYFTARDRLLDALNQPGPGELVHPYRGTFLVQLISCRMTESTREGGLARFQLEFIEARTVSAPARAADTQLRVRSQAELASTAATTQFATSWPANLGATIDSAIGSVLGAVRAVETVLGTVTATLDEIGGIVSFPQRIASRVGTDIRRIGSLAGLRRLFTYRATSASRLPQAVAEAAAVTTLVRVQAVIAATELAAGTVFDSFDAAIRTRDELVDVIDLVGYAVDDASYAALQDLRARLVEDIRSRAVDLSRIARYTPPATLPAVVVAYRLYGARTGVAGLLQRADDIVARNGLAHPGFVAGGVELEVLSD